MIDEHRFLAGCRSTAVLLPLVAAFGCGDSGNPSTAGQSERSAASALVASSTPAAVAEIEQVPAAQPPRPRIVLTEIVYRPGQGAAPFVELANIGADAVALQPLTLMIGTTPIPLERAGKELGQGAYQLIVFDGPARAEGATYHAGDKVTLATDAGHVSVLDKFGATIDEVAWGRAPDAVNASAGGARFEADEGMSIGRPPGAATPRIAQSWVAYPRDQVTPGAANPPPAVRALHPMSGTVRDRAGASLSWFPVPGASGYRVQVASDEAFASVVLERTVNEPSIDVATLPAARYAWRVQAQFGKEDAAYSGTAIVTLAEATAPKEAARRRQRVPVYAGLPFAAIAGPLTFPRSHIALVDGASTLFAAAPTMLGEGDCPSPTALTRTSCVVLPVPLIKQHKDTRMLLLEHPVPLGAHAWDDDHHDLDKDDPADNANCGLASLAMMNHFAHGDLSQDRIGYEVFKDTPLRGYGPEHDLNYGEGLSYDDELPKAYSYALGTTPTWGRAPDLEHVWSGIKSQIEHGRPVLVFSPPSAPPAPPAPAHFFVVVGYKVVDGNRMLRVNDPWEDARVWLELGDAQTEWFLLNCVYYEPGGDFVAQTQEATITQDSDGDEVVDFDETERFHTDPHSNDTDRDGVGDKHDIYASVFDESYGYARFRTGRDEDGDGKAMELDSDSDAGGCIDGDEDVNGNGVRETARSETWNFAAYDDSCKDLAGHLTYRHHSSGWVVPNQQWGEEDTTSTLAIRLKAVPHEPGRYEDDGSTFHFTGATAGTIDMGDCTILAKSWASDSGNFLGADAAPGTGEITEYGKLALHFVAGVRWEATTGWADLCGMQGEGHAGNSYSAEFRDECLGDPVQSNQPGSKTYVFDCHDPNWDATGRITVAE